MGVVIRVVGIGGRWLAGLMVAVVLGAAGCGAPPATPAEPVTSATPGRGYAKVLVIAEENKGYDEIIGSPDAPYLNELAGTYGTATKFDAGYPARCPSLAAYILLTSGTDAGICDDRPPAAHPLRGDNLFRQVVTAGGQWRNYAESAPGPCAMVDGAGGRYLVRHVPATYYAGDRADCARWTVPMGRAGAGALHDDVSAGTLPEFGFVSPDACDDMHGAAVCPDDPVGRGDRWLRSWLPSVLAGPDYRAGRLVVVVTWDEGTATDNHIPTLVLAPTTRRVVATGAFTHCSTLRTIEEILGLPLLGCAAGAPSMVSAFKL